MMDSNVIWIIVFLTHFHVALSSSIRENNQVHVLETEPLSISMIKKLTSENLFAQIGFLEHPEAGKKAHIVTYDNGMVKEKVAHDAHIHLSDITQQIENPLTKSSNDNSDMRRKCLKTNCTDNGPFPYFPTLDEINEWTKKLVKKNRNVSLQSIGETVEGRSLNLLIINGGKDLPVVFIESGIHAREWLSVSTALYMIHKIVNGSSSDLTKRFEFQFLISTNPDGYAYTHAKNDLSHRLWRKNRRVLSSKCIGVDLNRNFNVDFGKRGVSANCQADQYPGPKAFSENESQALHSHLLMNKNHIKFYLSLHTFSQVLMFPYGFTDKDAPNHDQLMDLAKEAVKTIKKISGVTYHAMKIIDFAVVSGSSIDYAYAKANISLSFVYELRPANFKTHNFIVPTSYIAPTGEEIFASLIAMLRKTF